MTQKVCLTTPNQKQLLQFAASLSRAQTPAAHTQRVIWGQAVVCLLLSADVVKRCCHCQEQALVWICTLADDIF